MMQRLMGKREGTDDRWEDGNRDAGIWEEERERERHIRKPCYPQRCAHRKIITRMFRLLFPFFYTG